MASTMLLFYPHWVWKCIYQIVVNILGKKEICCICDKNLCIMLLMQKPTYASFMLVIHCLSLLSPLSRSVPPKPFSRLHVCIRVCYRNEKATNSALKVRQRLNEFLCRFMSLREVSWSDEFHMGLKKHHRKLKKKQKNPWLSMTHYVSDCHDFVTMMWAGTSHT